MKALDIYFAMPAHEAGSHNLLLVRDQLGQPTSFTQQGNVDWIALSQASIVSSVAVMARLSGAGVDPFTVAVGQALAFKFRLSQLGEHRLRKTLSELPSFSGFGNMLWFGFGIKYIVRNLASTMEGKNCVMLCACLSEIHSVEYSARVLSSLFDMYIGPGARSLRPSLEQWVALVKICCGILSASAFPVLAEHMMGQAGHARIATSRPGSRLAGDHVEIARALDAVARLSNGTLKAAKLIGGPECGFIAAVAHWFFEIEVELRTSDGTILQASSNANGKAQLTVIYESHPGRQQALMSMVSSETYAIHDLTSNLFRAGSASNTRITGRVPWKEALRGTFGKTFGQLLSKQDFGSVLGSAARIFQGLSHAEPEGDFTYLQLKSWCAYSDRSYGQGYLNCAISVFPELSELRRTMETAVDVPYRDAVAVYQSAQARLTTVCACRICSDGNTKHTFCLPLLAEVIIRIALCLSILVVDINIDPSRAGLEDVYHHHRSLFRDRHSYIGEESPKETGSLLPLLTLDTIRELAITVFTGRGTRPSRIGLGPEDSTAVVSGGLVFYLNILTAVSDRPDEMICLHVTPGRIEVESGRTFDILLDSDTPLQLLGDLSGPIRVENLRELEEGRSHQPSRLAMSDNPIPQGLKIEAYIEETAASLSMGYHLVCEGGSASFGPLAMTRLINQSTGLVHCNSMRSVCTAIAKPLPPLMLLSGDGQVTSDQMASIGRHIGIRRVERDPLARCAALIINAFQLDQSSEHVLNSEGELSTREESDGEEGSDNDDNADSVVGTDDDRPLHLLRILQVNECILCCVRAAIQHQGEQDRVYIVQS